jgi:hypothetical protein
MPPVPSPPPPSAAIAPPAPRNGLGVASLVLGVIGLVTSWLVVGALVGVAAFAVGLAARARVLRGEANNRGTAVAGIVLGLLAIVVGLAVLAMVLVEMLYFKHHVCTARPGLRC